MACFLSQRQINMKHFVRNRVHRRKSDIYQAVTTVCRIMQDVLKHVEALEPRFISSLKQVDGRYAGLQVLSPRHLEVSLFLNQMGVFNFIDDGCPSGCAMLKLSDERKRSMSLWTEFITASGYLSARKMRSRFTSLVSEAIRRGNLQAQVRIISTNSFSTVLSVTDIYTVEIVPAFRCGSIWPQNTCVWPTLGTAWPSQPAIANVKMRGFNLLARDPYPAAKPINTEGDAWVLSFTEAEELLLSGGCRKLCVSMLKALCDKHLNITGDPIEYVHLTNLVLYECEKHPREYEWDEDCLFDRINGVLLQLVSCLQCRKCPHFFLKGVDLFNGKSKTSLDQAAKQVWILARDLTTNPIGFESL
ncbi:protein mab-21-like 2 [Actinia tenebrosa]|uniref:Protein mab-21-like 2 n=1 Tax=Actinia tenebrosa TaxID=6105 RepID=A0A6P8HAT1_ACTTE|nr:protein mab-21-like 2 [Actinia tenebrosa]